MTEQSGCQVLEMGGRCDCKGKMEFSGVRERFILIVIVVTRIYTWNKIHRNVHENKRLILLYIDFLKLAIVIPKLGPILLLYHKHKL